MTVFPETKKASMDDVDALQREASDPDVSAWVSASAGSGKTKVLSDRIARLLLAGSPPQKIVCLTFTKAAAAEMSIRLTQRLSDWATCGDDDLRDDLRRLQGRAPDDAQCQSARRLFAQTLACPGGMRLQTIHSFAQEILCRFPLEAGLPPHFVVMEDTAAASLREEALNDVLQDCAEGVDPAAAKALRVLSLSLGEKGLADRLKEICSQGQKIDEALKREGGLEPLLACIRGKLGLDPSDTEESFLAQACKDSALDRDKIAQAGRVLQERGGKTDKKRGAAICGWLALDEAARRASFAFYRDVFLKKNEEGIRAKLANKEALLADPAIQDALETEAIRLESLVERLQTARFFHEGAALILLGTRVTARYEARKAARAALDYDDLISRTKALLSRDLVPAWVLFKMDGGLDHILLDEAQDTNPAAWDIIKFLTDEFFAGKGARPDVRRTLFVVGDEKQSIYSFLKADPQEFERNRIYFSRKIKDSGAEYRETPLHVSFRSAPAVLRGVDAIFASEDVRRGVSREPVEHRAKRRDATGRVEVWDLFPQPAAPEDKTNKKKEVTEWLLPLDVEKAGDPVKELAENLADRIRGWIDGGQAVFDRKQGCQRSVKAGDIMVLVQTRRSFVEIFVRALKDRGVPVSGVDRMRVATQIAVMDLAALMQFSLLPQDDLNLACVLRGPLIGASEEDLMALAVAREGTLWQSLRKASEKDKKIDGWRDYLEKSLSLSDRLPPLALLTHILNSPCPADEKGGRRAMAARLGPESEDPMDELLNLAEAFARDQTPSLQAFLHWLVSTEADVKRELEQSEGRVRIVTVHGAKGLESPIVILPDTVRVPRSSSLPKILWDKDSTPFYVPSNPKNGTLRSLHEAARTAQLEEYRRLFYVALTRAADRLIVCGYEPGKKESFEESWYALARKGLEPLHQPEVLAQEDGALAPAVVLTDYGVPFVPSEAREKEETMPAPPLWLFAPPPLEPTPPRPLVPSSPGEPEPPSLAPRDGRFARGLLIHKLLQNLPDLSQDRQEEAARRFLSNPQHGLSPQQAQDVVGEVLGLLRKETFAPLFAAASKAEVPIVGLSGARLISGQVDRLALVGDEVWIVDYKTNRPPPSSPRDIPPLYRAQMEAYRTVLQAVYPDKKVRCFLLWTYAVALMEVVAEGAG